MTAVIVAAVLRRGTQVLLCHRSPSRENYPNVWDLAGGHVEEGETLYEALRRELFEELGVTLPLTPTEPRLRQWAADWDMTAWVIDEFTGEPSNCAPEEHDEIRWFEISETQALDLAHEGDHEFLASLG